MRRALARLQHNRNADEAVYSRGLPPEVRSEYRYTDDITFPNKADPVLGKAIVADSAMYLVLNEHSADTMQALRIPYDTVAAVVHSDQPADFLNSTWQSKAQGLELQFLVTSPLRMPKALATRFGQEDQGTDSTSAQAELHQLLLYTYRQPTHLHARVTAAWMNALIARTIHLPLFDAPGNEHAATSAFDRSMRGLQRAINTAQQDAALLDLSASALTSRSVRVMSLRSIWPERAWLDYYATLRSIKSYMPPIKSDDAQARARQAAQHASQRAKLLALGMHALAIVRALHAVLWATEDVPALDRVRVAMPSDKVTLRAVLTLLMVDLQPMYWARIHPPRHTHAGDVAASLRALQQLNVPLEAVFSYFGEPQYFQQHWAEHVRQLPTAAAAATPSSAAGGLAMSGLRAAAVPLRVSGPSDESEPAVGRALMVDSESGTESELGGEQDDIVESRQVAALPRLPSLRGILGGEQGGTGAGAPGSQRSGALSGAASQRSGRGGGGGGRAGLGIAAPLAPPDRRPFVQRDLQLPDRVQLMLQMKGVWPCRGTPRVVDPALMPLPFTAITRQPPVGSTVRRMAGNLWGSADRAPNSPDLFGSPRPKSKATPVVLGFVSDDMLGIDTTSGSSSGSTGSPSSCSSSTRSAARSEDVEWAGDFINLRHRQPGSVAEPGLQQSLTLSHTRKLLFTDAWGRPTIQPEKADESHPWYAAPGELPPAASPVRRLGDSAGAGSTLDRAGESAGTLAGTRAQTGAGADTSALHLELWAQHLARRQGHMQRLWAVDDDEFHGHGEALGPVLGQYHVEAGLLGSTLSSQEDTASGLPSRLATPAVTPGVTPSGTPLFRAATGSRPGSPSQLRLPGVRAGAASSVAAPLSTRRGGRAMSVLSLHAGSMWARRDAGGVLKPGTAAAAAAATQPSIGAAASSAHPGQQAPASLLRQLLPKFAAVDKRATHPSEQLQSIPQGGSMSVVGDATPVLFCYLDGQFSSSLLLAWGLRARASDQVQLDARQLARLARKEERDDRNRATELLSVDTFTGRTRRRAQPSAAELEAWNAAVRGQESGNTVLPAFSAVVPSGLRRFGRDVVYDDMTPALRQRDELPLRASKQAAIAAVSREMLGGSMRAVPSTGGVQAMSQKLEESTVLRAAPVQPRGDWTSSSSSAASSSSDNEADDHATRTSVPPTNNTLRMESIARVPRLSSESTQSESHFGSRSLAIRTRNRRRMQTSADGLLLDEVDEQANDMVHPAGALAVIDGFTAEHIASWALLPSMGAADNQHNAPGLESTLAAILSSHRAARQLARPQRLVGKLGGGMVDAVAEDHALATPYTQRFRTKRPVGLIRSTVEHRAALGEFHAEEQEYQAVKAMQGHAFRPVRLLDPRHPEGAFSPAIVPRGSSARLAKGRPRFTPAARAQFRAAAPTPRDELNDSRRVGGSVPPQLWESAEVLGLTYTSGFDYSGQGSEAQADRITVSGDIVSAQTRAAHDAMAGLGGESLRRRPGKLARASATTLRAYASACSPAVIAEAELDAAAAAAAGERSRPARFGTDDSLEEMSMGSTMGSARSGGASFLGHAGSPESSWGAAAYAVPEAAQADPGTVPPPGRQGWYSAAGHLCKDGIDWESVMAHHHAVVALLHHIAMAVDAAVQSGDLPLANSIPTLLRDVPTPLVRRFLCMLAGTVLDMARQSLIALAYSAWRTVHAARQDSMSMPRSPGVYDPAWSVLFYRAAAVLRTLLSAGPEFCQLLPAVLRAELVDTVLRLPALPAQYADPLVLGAMASARRIAQMLQSLSTGKAGRGATRIS